MRQRSTGIQAWRGKNPLPIRLNASVMKPFGYRFFKMREAGCTTGRKVYARRLVALAFLGVPTDPSLTDVGHLNGEPDDDRVGNLRWMTHREVMLFMMEMHGTMQCGEKCVTAKLTIDQVAEIRRIYATECKAHGEIAAQFGISRQHVGRLIRRQLWAHL